MKLHYFNKFNLYIKKNSRLLNKIKIKQDLIKRSSVLRGSIAYKQPFQVLGCQFSPFVSQDVLAGREGSFHFTRSGRCKLQDSNKVLQQSRLLVRHTLWLKFHTPGSLPALHPTSKKLASQNFSSPCFTLVFSTISMDSCKGRSADSNFVIASVKNEKLGNLRRVANTNYNEFCLCYLHL